MSVPTDKEIRKATAAILKVCDVQNTKLKDIRKQLEEKFNCSLTDKKDVILEAFDKFITQHEDLIAYNDVVAAEIEQSGADEADDAAPVKKAKSKGGFAAEVHLASELAEFLGSELMPRTQVTKLVWAYIKEHELQDQHDRRKINCDVALEKVLKRKSVHMFTMTKILSAMMKSPKEVNLDLDTEWDGGDVKSERKSSKASKASKTGKDSKSVKKESKVVKSEKKRKHSQDGGEEGGSSKKAKNSNFTISSALCDALSLQPSDARTEVVKKIWEYVRTNGLQNPADKREIKLDAPLQSVFKVKTCTMFSINKLIAAQMIRKIEG